MLMLLGGVSLYVLTRNTRETIPEKRAPQAPDIVTQQSTTPELPRSVVEPPPFTIALPAPFSDADILQFLAASYAAGKSDGSDIAMAKGLLGSPVSRATAQWLLARSGIPLTYQWYNNFRKSTPDWPQTIALKRRTETALLTGQMPDEEKARYLTANPPLTSSGRIFMGKLLLAAGRKQDALEMIRPVWTREKLMDPTERQMRIDYAGLLTPQDHRLRMILLMAAKNWDGALRAAKDAGENAELLVRARMAVTTNAKDAQALINALPAAIQDDSLALFSRWLLFLTQKKIKESTDVLIRLTADKNAPALSALECRDWQTQQRILARNRFDAKDFNGAYRAAAAPLSARGCIHGDADFLAGWIALRFLNRADAAQTHFEILAANADTDSRKARGAYWLGRVFEKRGDADKAKKAYEQAASFWNSFYGQVTAERLAVPLTLPTSTVELPEERRQQLESTTGWQAIRLLEVGNATDLAAALYGELATTTADEGELRALSALATEMRNARAALTISKIAAQRGFNPGTWGYPDFGLPEVPKQSSSSDKALLYSISRQESAFNPKARSSAGALGLTQLMPGTARMTAERSGVAFNMDRLTQDPSYNASLGMAHFATLQTEWRGSLIMSFAAYNAGSGNVKKWINTYGDPRLPDIDAIDWIESIPFMETRHYVQRLMENVTVYRALMGVKLSERLR